MITPARILNRYRSVEPYLDPVRIRVRDSLLVLCEREGLALVGRIKTLESVSEKVESGRFRSWGGIDDLVAFTIVVPRLADEVGVLAYLNRTFEQVALRPRGRTLKSPETFRFDSTRFIARLTPPAGEDPPAPLFQVPFEVQIKSAFEHAWAVTTHALTYKTAQISWSKQRLAAQLKAAVEQLDTLVAAFEDAAKYIEESDWPEIQVKAEIQAFFSGKVASGEIPSELAPKDWSRFVDNVYSAVRAGHENVDPRDVGRLVRQDLEAELKALGPGGVPRSVSLWQLTFASLVKSGTFGTTPRRFWPLITPELEDLYPSVRAVNPRFDYA